MKAFLFSLALAFVPVGLLACGGAATQVEMKGKDPELAQLAGNWEGSYTGIDSGRTGPVRFSLELGRHTADGQVLLDGKTPLKISFVAVQGGEVSGRMEPYTDPRCSCQVETEFVGTLLGDAISGSFTSTLVGKDVEQRGEWSVTRTDG